MAKKAATLSPTKRPGRKTKKQIEEEERAAAQQEEEEEEEELEEEDAEEVDNEEEIEEDSIIYDTETPLKSSNGIIKPEEIFYKPPSESVINNRGGKRKSVNGKTISGGKTSASITEEMGDESWSDKYNGSRCQQISSSEYYMQTELYTEQQLELLSSEIRRHPSLAEKSYHFLSFGIHTKIQHQWIRVVISLLILLSLVAIVFYLPLPHLKHINLSPNGPSITQSPKEFEKDSFDPYSMKLTAFKDNWRRFSILGSSNFLCSNYNFNPISNHGVNSGYQEKIPKEFSSAQELKNLKIFGSCILFGITLFVAWLIAARLSEKEIIIKSNIPMQLIHSLLTIVVIPFVTMIFCSMLLLYIVQTVLIGTQANGREDTFYCINRISMTMSELGTLAPIRELFLGSVGIVMRLVNYFYQLPIEALALHDNADGKLSVNEMKFVSFLWTIIIGSTLYHTLMIINYVYSIFHEYSPKDLTQGNGNKASSSSASAPSASASAAGSAMASAAVNTSTKPFDPDSLNLLKLDLKYLPSFIPEVLLTLNFIIVMVWAIAACFLWVFGLPPNLHIHEGEVFYIVISLTPLIKSIYSLIIIDQKKDKIIKIHKKNTWKSEPELIDQVIFNSNSNNNNNNNSDDNESQ